MPVIIPNTESSTGQTEPFGAVYDRLYGAIFGYVFRRVANYDRACDIVSETFLKACLKQSAFQSRQGVPIDAWIYRIATNEINQFFRQRHYEPVSLTQLTEDAGYDPPAPETLEAERAEAERQLAQHADFLAVQRILLTLPLPYQAVLALRYFEQKSIADIALILNKPEGTIKSLLSRGVAKLRQGMVIK